MAVSSTTDLLQRALELHRRGAVAEAAARYAEVLHADPANADAQYYLGLMACQGGRFAEGAELARQLLARDPQHVRAHVLLGRALSELGRHQEALESVERAIALAPGLPQAHSHRADVLTDLGRTGEAIESYDRALLLAPDAVEDWCNRGLALDLLGRRDEAISSFDRAVACRPDFARAHLWRAKVLSDLGRYNDALEGVDKALAIDPRLAEGWLGRGNVLVKLKRYDSAFAAYDKALSTKPDLAEAWLGRGNILTQLKRYEDALADYEKGLAVKPDLAEAWLGRGNVLFELKRYDEALADYERALALEPNLAGGWFGRGAILFELERYDDALIAYDRALRQQPDLAEAWLGRGNAFSELKRYDDAFAAYDKALSAKPELAEAWFGRGNVFTKLKRCDDAIVAYDKALALKTDLAEAWLGRGNAFYELKQSSNARAAYDQALALKPDLAEAWLGRGNVLSELKQQRDALAAYQMALTLKSDLAEAWVGRGNVLSELKQQDNALMAFDKALALRSDLAEAWLGRGNVLIELKSYDHAAAAYERALGLRSDLDYAASFRLHAKLHICDWTNLEVDAAQLLSTGRTRKTLNFPFTLLGTPSSAADQLECAKRHVQSRPTFPPLWRGEVYAHERIRVAYLSADFLEHPTGHLTVGMFEQHDRSRFEVTGISFGPDQNSTIRRRLKSAFEYFIDVADRSDQEIADLVRQLEIDIAVDLMGFIAGNRHGILARRPAPLQVNYLGYPGTMGAGYMDYIIADPVIIPEQHFAFYSEQVVWLPDCYQPNDANRYISRRKPTRSECELPETAFVFCCFNNAFKILPEVFDTWMRLLAARGNSVLWLIETNQTATQNLGLEAEKHGISSERLIFAAKIPLSDHLARLSNADLVLDTVPYNAHTTASDALWAGVPLITCLGSTFASRVAASLLKAVGLDELVTHSLQDYEALALGLANDPSRLRALRERLAHNRTTNPLFDTKLFTRHIEAAYKIMWQQYQRGGSPKAFAVNRIRECQY